MKVLCPARRPWLWFIVRGVHSFFPLLSVIIFLFAGHHCRPRLCSEPEQRVWRENTLLLLDGSKFPAAWWSESLSSGTVWFGGVIGLCPELGAARWTERLLICLMFARKTAGCMSMKALGIWNDYGDVPAAASCCCVLTFLTLVRSFITLKLCSCLLYLPYCHCNSCWWRMWMSEPNLHPLNLKYYGTTDGKLMVSNKGL